MRFENLLTDYKTALQELTQERFGVLPSYELLAQRGPDHKKEFFIQVCIHDAIYAKASGNSKKSAQQACAKLAYEELIKESTSQKCLQKDAQKNPQNQKESKKDSKQKNKHNEKESYTKDKKHKKPKSAKKSQKKAQK